MSDRYILRDAAYDERLELVDTLSDEEIAIDGGEPEDQTFYRNWSWVVPLLNQLDQWRKDYLDVADTILPVSNSKEDLIAEVRRLRRIEASIK